ncbi:MAG: leucyl-tRNA synthetase [Planctomycetota bacterium]|jgi:leucyl-tRNA synthetase
MAYKPSKIEPKWQAYWSKEQTFKTDAETNRPTYYVLDMFPYPSGSGLHVGHVEGYTASDIMARYKRHQGFEVLHPMGWDAFGLPAEQYAIEQGVHPAKSTRANVENFRQQLQLLGFSYDWDREVGTYDPEFFKWTQWIFLKLLEHDLAYQTEVPVNWCPALGTVLANDEVIDGKSERGDHPVIRKPMKQWMLRITKFAERLLEGLDRVDFPESIKLMQKDRIGRSEGADATFKIKGHDAALEIFTTRPDTMFGATFCVLAPEHPLVDVITTAEYKEAITSYAASCAAKSDIERSGPEAGKTGVFTGAMAINPANGREVPIWIADYVMMGYGTGAIMSVPGHDERDWDFATKFELPIVEVVSGGDVTQEAYVGEGPHNNSSFLDGMNKADAINAMNNWLEENSHGKKIVRYRLRDWIFARQRYWGEPIPVIHDESGQIHGLPTSDLPVVLPDVENYQPTGTGKSPLATREDWVNQKVPGQEAMGKRETDTMPGSAGSSWYFLRFIDPLNNEEMCRTDLSDKWMPVDLYIGGAEHAVGHLLYSRFWTKFLHDLGLCSVDEPYAKLVNQGMILGEDNRKMSKRYGNVVNPNDVVAEHGADSLRIYEMFMGPIESEKPWNTTGVDGIRRFLSRLWRLYFNEENQLLDAVQDVEPTPEQARLWHKTIEKVTKDFETLRFNTAISQLMVLVNGLTKDTIRPRKILEDLVIMLSPMAPHLSEELWSALGHEGGVSRVAFPEADPKWLVEDEVEIPVQVNGKVKTRLTVPKDISEEDIKAMAFADARIAAIIEGKELKKFLYIPGRMVTIAVKG